MQHVVCCRIAMNFLEAPIDNWCASWLADRQPNSFPFLHLRLPAINCKLQRSFEIAPLQQPWRSQHQWSPMSDPLSIHYNYNIETISTQDSQTSFQQLCAQTQQAWGIAKAHGGRLWKMWPSEVLVSCTQKPWFALMSKAGKDKKGDSKSLISIHHLWHKNEQTIILHICMIQKICHIGGDQPCFNIPKNTLALCSGESHRHHRECVCQIEILQGMR